MAIDIHTHIVPASLPPYLGHASDVPWPSIEHADCCHARVLVSGKPYREIEDNCWNTVRRIGEMTQMGITRQVLSPMPELLSWWLPAGDARNLGRYINEQIAAMVSEAPDRFVGFGMVPLQSVDLAIEELIHLTGTLGLKGVEIGTNVEGKAIGHPGFEPFFAEAEARGVPIFVHPLRPAGMDRLVGPAVLEQVVAFPCETAYAIASLMTGGLITRHPKLRIAFSHGGGTFGQMLPRLQHAWTMAPGLQKAMPRPPRELARTFFYDTLVYDRTALRFLIDQFGVGQLLTGTDYPFAIMEHDPHGRLGELDLSADQLRKITHENALRFLEGTESR
ncbi:MAG: amidohydrolase family protein [Parvibaculaceae bacterium]|nr:amidohydrolase family protein [Parvibaculaceae bacterium]